MTKKATGDVRRLTVPEIKEKIVVLRAELAKELAAKSSGTRPENPGKIGKIKKSIARHLTIVSEKEAKKTKGVELNK